MSLPLAASLPNGRVMPRARGEGARERERGTFLFKGKTATTPPPPLFRGGGGATRSFLPLLLSRSKKKKKHPFFNRPATLCTTDPLNL